MSLCKHFFVKTQFIATIFIFNENSRLEEVEQLIKIGGVIKDITNSKSEV
jgi:hypothetical protein